MLSISDKLFVAKYRPSGFDYLRIALSLMVVVNHSFLYCYGEHLYAALWNSPARLVFKPIVPMFFCLSGFLVAGSMERCKTLITFVIFRFIRIYPALAVEVLLSALLVGPAITDISRSKYFSNPEFFDYLLNITGHIHYILPGVFNNIPYNNIINSQLWTIPFELLCYVSIVIALILGAKSNRFLIPGLIFAYVSVHLFYQFMFHCQIYSGNAVDGICLVPFFLSGVMFYQFRSFIVVNRYIAIAMGLFSAVMLAYAPCGDFIAILSLSYFTVCLGLANPPRFFFVKYADLSYGVYLYGAVIQQLVVYEFPMERQWYLNIVIALPICILISVFSWYGVEKPAQGLKSVAKSLEDRWLARQRVVLKAQS